MKKQTKNSMETNKCLNPSCGKKLTHVAGRRKKQFCSSTCKSLVWYGANKAKAKLYRENKKREKELAEVVEKSFNKKTPEPVIYTSKENKEQFEKAVQNLNEGTNQVKDLTKPPPKTNYVVETRKPFMSDAIKKKLGL
jgi:endogenous inhibitor of DNA gyrase (YacG/DUF329 family)